MYPFCRDCIYQKLKWLQPQCERTHLPTQQSRQNPALCSEQATHFSPKFSNLNGFKLGHDSWNILRMRNTTQIPFERFD